MKIWQNLIHKQCPDCDAELQVIKEKTTILACKKCDFFITREKACQIIFDPNHKLRKHISQEERMTLERISR